MSTPNWGTDPLRAEAGAAANVAYVLMNEFSQGIANVLNDHRVRRGNQELVEQSRVLLEDFAIQHARAYDTLIAKVNRLCDHIDGITADNHKLDGALREAVTTQQGTADALRIANEKIGEQQRKIESLENEFNIERRKNVGLGRFREEASQRLAFQEETAFSQKREIGAYRALHPESAAKVQKIADQAPSLDDALSALTKCLRDNIRSYEQINVRFSDVLRSKLPIITELEAALGEIEINPEIKVIERLLRAAERFRNDPVIVEPWKELTPYFDRIMEQSRAALSEKTRLSAEQA